MALSGYEQINVSLNNTYALRITWSAFQSVNGNYSDVSAVVSVVKTGSNNQTYDLASKISLWIDGVQKADNQNYAFDMRGSAAGSVRDICSGLQRINHNANGTRAFVVRARWVTDTGNIGTDDITTPAQTLDTIPRGSVIGEVSPFYLEEGFSVPVTKYADSFTDTLTLTIGSTEILSIAGYISNTPIVFTDAQLLAAYNTMAGTEANAAFTVTTYNGSTLIGTSSAVTTASARGTLRLNANGTWKYAVPWIKVSGVWKKSVASLKQAGSWKRGA